MTLRAFQFSDALSPPPFGWIMPPSNAERAENERIGLALRQARKKAWGIYGSLTRTAERAGVSQGTLSAIERGDHPLSKVQPKNLQNFPEAYGLSVREFVELTGVALVTPMDKNDSTASTVNVVPNIHRVPVRSLTALGDNFYSEGAITHYQFVPDELFVPELLVVQAIDNVMAPVIISGDYVYVNQAETTLTDGKIYLLRLDDDTIALRRCRVLLQQRVLVADDPSIEALPISGVKVMGRAYHRQAQGDDL